ncbi:hypothetical protein L211DRAFT_834747 [Terfezia boudieri ATCC MYA-4762]|uniref:Uncharacterized protein n=1 Tax=Terfezia boudieri ATCC MYA-4762 TaxID=1051890 RepID=A0A3N4LVY5_9PEZI|nr:hypothetical protein L211DRAFT_834747 [Terfezia boudieri ATCC MYA-4762]
MAPFGPWLTISSQLVLCSQRHQFTLISLKPRSKASRPISPVEKSNVSHVAYCTATRARKKKADKMNVCTVYRYW